MENMVPSGAVVVAVGNGHEAEEQDGCVCSVSASAFRSHSVSVIERGPKTNLGRKGFI